MRRRDLIRLIGSTLAASPLLYGDVAVVSRTPLIAEYNLESLRGSYTPTPEFYVRDHFAIPSLPAQPTLRIEGEVEQSRTLTEADLSRLELRRVGAVLECSGNSVGPYELAGNAVWEGWALQDVLALARSKPSASYLHLYGSDGFLRSVPIGRAKEGALLVTRMNHQPLLPRHGAPWRAFFPGWYGMDSVKWLERIVVASSPVQPVPNDYWAELRGPGGQVRRQMLPPIQVKSVFTYPAVGAVLERGSVNARGLTWSNGAPIVAVEVSADGGKVWRLAQLSQAPKYEWRVWTATLDLTQSGVTTLACKAIGPGGVEQPVSLPTNRLDAYANNTIEQIRVMVM